MAVFPYRDPETRSCEWAPKVDVYRTPTGWALKFELPGVRMRDVAVDITDSVVRVTGVRRDGSLRAGWRHYSMEISYCRFERSVNLPGELEGASVRNSYQEGMLIVWIDVQEGGK
jgi:HSP20 family protein